MRMVVSEEVRALERASHWCQRWWVGGWDSRRRRGSCGGRPFALDAGAYRGRNVIERFFALAKQWRGIATRFDKLAITYRAGSSLCAILTWTRLNECTS